MMFCFTATTAPGATAPLPYSYDTVTHLVSSHLIRTELNIVLLTRNLSSHTTANPMPAAKAQWPQQPLSAMQP